MTDAWGAGLAATKLRPPVSPSQLVKRSRLDDVLDAGMDRHARLILVSAPAGSGKSTLLASWLAGRPEAVAWLQAERSDSDPIRFWSYLVEAIARAHPIAAGDVQARVGGSNGDEVVVVSALVNALADVAAPLLVVIDDYHLIDDARVHLGVERLVDLCPDQVTIVLATRIDPPFRLGRLRVRHQLAEVRSADLRFGVDEAPGLLGAVAPSLDGEQLDQLCDRTEGWAAGLVLAGLSLQRAADPARFIEAFRGDDQLVVEYLRDELLASVDDDDRRCLLETSILEQLTGGLVDAVTGTTGGARWLSDTAAVNQLVVGLDSSGTWFRYHHLLRDLLRLEAQENLGDRLSGLHARAAVWFEAHDEHRDAIIHRLAAGEPDEAARLMHVYGPRLLRAGQIETLVGLLERLGDVARTSTTCALLFGWCEYLAGRYALAEGWLETSLEVAPETFDRTYTVPLRINIILGRGDVAAALDVARAMDGADLLASHPSDLATACGAAYAWAGQATEARAALGLAVEKATRERSHTSHVLALVYLAVVELAEGSTTGAHAAATRAVETARAFGLGEYHGVAPAYAAQARSGRERADARIEAAQALALVRRVSTDLALGFVLAVCGDLFMDDEDRTGADLLAEARSIVDRCPEPGIVGRLVARAESRHGIGGGRDATAVGSVEAMTDRELAVLRYLPTTMSQRDIASELYVSLNTVKTHCRAIYRKLGVGDRKAAVQAARDRHLL